MGRVLNLLWRAGHFLPQNVYTKPPTAPIWNILNGKRILIKKKVIATKTKENSLAVGVL